MAYGALARVTRKLHSALVPGLPGVVPTNGFSFDLERGRYTGRQWAYRLDMPGYSVGDFTAVTERFRFPFQTIESVIPLGPNELGVLNDNNYPFSTGRAPDRPDANEFIVIRLNRPLNQYAKNRH